MLEQAERVHLVMSFIVTLKFVSLANRIPVFFCVCVFHPRFALPWLLVVSLLFHGENVLQKELSPPNIERDFFVNGCIWIGPIDLWPPRVVRRLERCIWFSSCCLFRFSSTKFSNLPSSLIDWHLSAYPAFFYL